MHVFFLDNDSLTGLRPTGCETKDLSTTLEEMQSTFEGLIWKEVFTAMKRFEAVENAPLAAMVDFLNRDVVVSIRKNIRRRVLGIYEDSHVRMLGIFNGVPGKVSLTADAW